VQKRNDEEIYMTGRRISRRISADTPENAVIRSDLNFLLVMTLTIGLLLGLAETARADGKSTSFSYLPL